MLMTSAVVLNIKSAVTGSEITEEKRQKHSQHLSEVTIFKR